MIDTTAGRYYFDFQQGYRIGNAYSTTALGVSYLQPQYIFSNPPQTIKCNIKQPLTGIEYNPATVGGIKDLVPANFPNSPQSDGITQNCDILKKRGVQSIIGF